MVGINFSVHPLFFAFGVYYALTGRIFVFIIYTLSAVAHELGHSLVAANAGYKLNKITLMPFGAVVSGDIDGLKLSDEIKIALAGPLTSLAIGLFFVATWWLFPETYAFTDVVAQANFSMAAINFLPIFPLDGGRVLSATLCKSLGKKRADKICKTIGLIFSFGLIVLFIFSLFHTVNISLLFFALFVIFGSFGKAKENKYIRLYSSLSAQSLKRGMPFKKHALHKTASVKKLISLIDETAVNEVAVFDGDKVITTLTPRAINSIIETGDLYAPVERYI